MNRPVTSSAERLATLRGADFRLLHTEGTAPSLESLDGVIDGTVLNGQLGRPLVRELRLWRGKVFEHDAGTVAGLNRLGLGPLEVRRYRFEARIAGSLFSDREVLLLDHDEPANPPYVRRFHDELVEVEEGLYVATSHHWSGDRLRYLCHFALAKSRPD